MAKQATIKKSVISENTESTMSASKVQTPEPQKPKSKTRFPSLSQKKPGTKEESLPPQEKLLPATAEPESPDVFSADFVKEAIKRKKEIEREYCKVDKSRLSIMLNLHWLSDNDGFKPLGYKNIYDLAKNEFNIARGTTCEYINVIDRFGERDELGNFTGKINEKYKDFSSSKLILMTKLKDDELDMVKPDMSVRELKKEISFIMDKGTEGTEGTEIKTTEQGTEFSQAQEYHHDAVKETSFQITRQALISCKSQLDYQRLAPKIDDLIINAFKSRPDAKIEIILVTSDEKEVSASSETEEPEGKGA